MLMDIFFDVNFIAG